MDLARTPLSSTPMNSARHVLPLSLMILAAATSSASASSFGNAVVNVVPGTGSTHVNFDDPADVLGMPNYADPGGTGFGFGAYSLGVGGSVTVTISTLFRGGGTSAADLIIHEIGPSSGGSSESTAVAVSLDGVTWTAVGTTPGGSSGINLDAFGFGPAALLRYVRLTDASFNPGIPAGSDIDAIEAVHAVPTWSTVGSGLAGINGVPLLSGTGTLTASSACSLALTSARPSAPTLLFVALSSTPVPFKGGALVAWPAATTVTLITDGSGALLLPFTWPTGIPAGLSLYFQCALQDAAAIQGVSLSNGLKGITG